MIKLVITGNTSIKVYRYIPGSLGIDPERYALTDINRCIEDLHGAREVYIASVVPSITSDLTTSLGKKARVITADSIPLHNRTRYPEQTGIDRLLNGLAALTDYPGKNCIIADCGTAISISVVTATEDFLGGAILSGVETEYKALAASTALLPEITRAEFPEACIGRTTDEAIRSGVLWGKIGAIKEIVRQTGTELSSAADTVTIITGGWGKMISGRLDLPHYHDEHLTARGLAKALEV